MPSCDPPVVAAVIVAYYPVTETLACQLAALVPQVAQVVVVDNGSTGAARAWLEAENAAGRLQLLRSNTNLGIGAAQNMGVAAARRHRADMVLLLDQDSEPAPDMVAQLVAAYQRLDGAGQQVGLLAPHFFCCETGEHGRFLHQRGGTYAKCACDADATRPVDVAIASGSLIPLAAWDIIGPMDEDLFIDAVDSEWCLRARSLGYGIYAVGAARLAHRLGEGSRRILLPGGWRQVAIHGPSRSYTIARNNLLLCRMPHVPPAWRRYTIAMLCRRLGYFLIFGPRRFAHLVALLRGSFAGLAGRRGPPPDFK